jgi:adenosine deaminase
VNTDDPTLFGVELVDEYMRLIDNEIFSLGEVVQLVRNGINATFQTQTHKRALLADLDAVLAKSEYAGHLST